MGTKIETNQDIVSFLKAQHREVRRLFDRVLLVHGDARLAAFRELRQLLSLHEMAEEQIVHPVARRILRDGESMVRARLREEEAAKATLAEFESLSLESPVFEQKLQAFRNDVIAHADKEELEEFEHLGAKLDPRELHRMRRDAERAGELPPTRPQPWVHRHALG